MKNLIALAGLLLAAACAAGDGGNQQGGDLRSLVVGKTFLNGDGHAINYAPDGSYVVNDVRLGAYSFVGWNVYLSYPDAITRSIRIGQTESGLNMTTFNQSVSPLRPVASTLVGVGTVRQGAECSGLEGTFPANMRLSASTWSISMPGRRYATGSIDGQGFPVNQSGVRLDRFTPEHHQGFTTRGDCIIDWDLKRT